MWLEKARRANPALAFVHAYLTFAYVFKGEIERAAAEIDEACRLSVDGRYSSIVRLKATQYFGVSKVCASTDWGSSANARSNRLMASALFSRAGPFAAAARPRRM